MKSVFFIHNPKAGGSSLRALLASPFPAETIAPVFLNSPYDNEKLSNHAAELKGFRFYAGHYGYDAYTTLADGHVLITNFRDPVRRIESIYRYWKHNVDLGTLREDEVEPVALAQSLPFTKFIRHPLPALRLYLENFHFRQLLGSGWETCSCTRMHRLIVKWRVARMKWFFIQEMSEVSLALLQRTFATYRNATLPVINVSGGPRADISGDDAAYLASINQLDYEIYAQAQGLQARRAAALLRA